MSGYLLDTNICIHSLKGDAAVNARLRAVGLTSCFLSEVTKAELLYGIARSAPERQSANRQQFEALCQSFDGRILPIGGALETFGQQKARLRAMGRMVEDFDLLIGCTALAHDLTLVTRNTRHFADLPGLHLENRVAA